MASIIRQFALLAWKNWLLTRRRPIVTACELLMPLVMPAVLLLLRPFVDATVADRPTRYDPFVVGRLPPGLRPPLLLHPDLPAPPTTPRNVWLVAYAPDVEIVSTVMNITMSTVNTIYFPAMNDSVPFYHAKGE